MKKVTNSIIFTSTTIGSTQPGGSIPNGSSQPPRNIVTAIPETTNMFMYSANRYATNGVPPYSVKYPPTSSASASTRSNGARLVSANDAVMKIRKPTNCGMMYQRPALSWTLAVADRVPS